MPPSMLSSEALVIWMLRIAMNAPIIAASTEIQTWRLARSGLRGAVLGALATARGAGVAAETARSDMASPFGNRVGDLGHDGRPRWIIHARQRFDGREHGHAGAQLHRGAVERDFHRHALNHFGEIAGGVVR